MKRRITARTPTPQDLEEIAANLLPADIEEIRICAGGLTPLQTLEESFKQSELCFVFSCGGIPIAIGGTIRVSPTVGNVWVLTTEAVKKFRLAFVREAKEMLSTLATGFDHIGGRLWTGNVHNYRLAHAVGIAFSKPSPNNPFVTFSFNERQKQKCHQ